MAAPWQIYGTTNPCFGSCFWKPALLNIIIFWLLQMKSQKKQQRFYETSASMKLFPTRESDLERLSLYLSEVDAVGINGTWGSGKTFLADQYIERNQDKYEVIKVEPLTCNMSAIDSYLFQQLEKVLRANPHLPQIFQKAAACAV